MEKYIKTRKRDKKKKKPVGPNMFQHRFTGRVMEALQTTGHEVLRPGFVRVGVHFAMTDADVETIAHAVAWVAENGCPPGHSKSPENFLAFQSLSIFESQNLECTNNEIEV